MPLARIKQKLSALVSPSGEPEGVQHGAIPYRIVDGQVVFLMITSRRSANWVFPKGSAIKGLSPWEVAARETLEEAGVRGEIDQKPVGSYLHPRNNDAESLVRVDLYPMLVTKQVDSWQEEAERFRHWALLAQVRRLMASREAARIAANLNRRILSGNYPPVSKRISA